MHADAVDGIGDRMRRALADVTRRAMLRALQEQDLSAGEIAVRFPLMAASVSHRLGILEEAGP